MLPTPDTSHLSFDNIYEPAEDSYLLLDTLSSTSESTFLQSHFGRNTPTPLVLEIGTGSGVVLAFVTAQAEAIFARTDIVTLGIDINKFACEATAQTVRRASSGAAVRSAKSGQYLDAVQGDLSTALRLHSVDVLIFNPPYVPTELVPSPGAAESERVGFPKAVDRFERDSKLLELSYAGGVDGMVVTNQLLAQLPDVLSERGVAYILLCAQNRPEEVKASIRSHLSTGVRGCNWSADTVGSSGKKAGWEKLVVIRVWRS